MQKSAAAVDSEEEEEQRQFEQELQQWKKTEVGLPSNVDTPSSFSAHTHEQDHSRPSKPKYIFKTVDELMVCLFSDLLYHHR